MSNFENLLNTANNQSPDQFLAFLLDGSQPPAPKPTGLSEGMMDFIKQSINLLVHEYDSEGYSDWRTREQFHARLRMRVRRMFYVTYGRNSNRDSELRTNIRAQVKNAIGTEL